MLDHGEHPSGNHPGRGTGSGEGDVWPRHQHLPSWPSVVPSPALPRHPWVPNAATSQGWRHFGVNPPALEAFEDSLPTHRPCHARHTPELLGAHRPGSTGPPTSAMPGELGPRSNRSPKLKHQAKPGPSNQQRAGALPGTPIPSMQRPTAPASIPSRGCPRVRKAPTGTGPCTALLTHAFSRVCVYIYIKEISYAWEEEETVCQQKHRGAKIISETSPCHPLPRIFCYFFF